MVTLATAPAGGTLRIAQLVRDIQEGTDGAPNHPLHQYRISDELIAELETLLLARLRQRSLGFSGAESAAFVLYCAHHFTRTYIGGHWTWAVAKGTIDPENRLVPPILYEIVDRGLRAWGRSVYWNGRHHEYLYTVGREGGLPLAVLVHERGEGLRSFLQRLLTRVETSTVSADEAAAELEHHLPAQLQQPEILRLAAELVSRLSELRALVPPDTEPSPRWLDEHLSGWRDHLPLRTNDGIAAALISGLVQQERPKPPDQGFALITQLVNGRLQRTLQTPKRLTGEELVGSGGATALPSRLRIAVSNGRVQSARAMATSLGDGEYVVERLVAEPLQGKAWFGNEIRLVVGIGERELTNRSLPGGEDEGDATLPRVFESDAGGAWLMVARGSYASKSESLIIAHPSHGAALKTESGSLEPAGEDPVLSWSFTRLRGVARWVSEQDVCEISSGNARSGVRFELRGTSEQLPGTGSFVWRGCPEVQVKSHQGIATRVAENALEWRPTGSAQPWQRLSRACLGDIQLRVREGDRTSYRARLTVVPSDFRLELSATQATAGTLRVLGSQVSGARLLTRDVESLAQIEPGRVTLEVRSPTPPAELEIEVQWGTSARLVLHAPFPSEFRGFISVDGSPLPNRGRIGVDTLSRWTARAVSCDTAQRFVLEAQTDHGFRAIAELPIVSPGLAELPLSRIRAALEACLSGTRSIDAFIPLRVTRHTGLVAGVNSRTEARLGWHEAQLDVTSDAESAAVELSQELLTQLDDWQVSAFHVLARPLHEPAADPISLEGNARDGWFFSPGEERLWLLTGWVGNALMTRPRLVQLENHSSRRLVSAAAAACLDSAMRVTTLDPRREALAAVYQKLSADYANEDWLRLDEFLRTLHELPPPTYDVLCALAAAKPAAVVALFRQPAVHFRAVWEGMEQLGISWYTIPIGLWLRAARLGRDFAFNSPHAEIFGGKGELLKQALSGLLGQVQSGPRFFAIVLAALSSYREGFPPEPQAGACLQLARTQHGRGMLRQQVRGACSELRRRVELTGDRFPPLRVSSHECCPDIHALLRDFGLSDQAAFTWECVAAPLVAAHIMVNGGDLTSTFLDDLRLLRSFDEEWFEFAHAVALTVLLGKKLEHDDEFFERAESQLFSTDG